MRYFLKKTTPSKKGLYLQIYQSNYFPKIGNRNKSYEKIGYYDELVAKGIKDPIAYAQAKVDELNKDLENKRIREIGDSSVTKNAGYFLLKSMIDYLEVDRVLNVMTQNRKTDFKMSDFLRSMIYAQIVNPGSKHNAFENVMPNILGIKSFSYDQILDAVNYIGQDYEKYIELFNHKIDEKFGRKVKKSYFDCTNYYFEVDLPSEDKQLGPSKEERHLPIIGQALLLDEEQIPLAMKMYPGNESEKPKITKVIDDIKNRYNIDSKIVQVADKGLNCARNIYQCVNESKNGYIFSKSVHGKNLKSAEKKRIKLENEENIWEYFYDKKGNLIYKIKECIDVFNYDFKDEDGKTIKFKVKEKRIAIFTPSFAKKKIAQIQKQIDKAKKCTTLKKVAKSELGDSAKYLNFLACDKNGEIIKPNITLNNKKIEEDLSLAGYNLIVTSELKMTKKEIYEAYHGLWRIEESFRIMKSYLEARPVYLQKQESIYGHFTICYLGLTILRLLEIKVFEDNIPVSQLIYFIRNFNVTEDLSGNYINNTTKSLLVDQINEKLQLSKLKCLYLSNKDIKNILDCELFFNI